MRELSTLDRVRRILTAAGMDGNGDGLTVTDVITGYAEPGYGNRYGGDEAIIVLGDWNPRNWQDPNRERQIGPRLARILEAAGAEIQWLDEWAECSHCYRAVRTQADSYSWTPYYAWVNECEIVCTDCLRENLDWVLEDYINDPSKAFTNIESDDLEGIGFTRVDETYENGWHPGQDDNPPEILERILKFAPEGTEVVFTIDGTGQFDVRFSAWVRTPETTD